MNSHSSGEGVITDLLLCELDGQSSSSHRGVAGGPELHRMLIDCKQDRRCAVSCAEVLIAVLNFYRFCRQHHRHHTKAGRKQQQRRGEGLERDFNQNAAMQPDT